MIRTDSSWATPQSAVEQFLMKFVIELDSRDEKVACEVDAP